MTHNCIPFPASHPAHIRRAVRTCTRSASSARAAAPQSITHCCAQPSAGNTCARVPEGFWTRRRVTRRHPPQCFFAADMWKTYPSRTAGCAQTRQPRCECCCGLAHCRPRPRATVPYHSPSPPPPRCYSLAAMACALVWAAAACCRRCLCRRYVRRRRGCHFVGHPSLHSRRFPAQTPWPLPLHSEHVRRACAR